MHERCWGLELELISFKILSPHYLLKVNGISWSINTKVHRSTILNSICSSLSMNHQSLSLPPQPNLCSPLWALLTPSYLDQAFVILAQTWCLYTWPLPALWSTSTNTAQFHLPQTQSWECSPWRPILPSSVFRINFLSWLSGQIKVFTNWHQPIFWNVLIFFYCDASHMCHISKNYQNMYSWKDKKLTTISRKK